MDKMRFYTQEEMEDEVIGKLVGVQKAQISRIENDKNLTFATVIRLFKAMGLVLNWK